MSIERREHERKTLSGPARLTVVGRPPVIVRMKDIGLGGVSVVSEVDIPTKQIVTLEFNILVRKSSVLTSLSLTAAVTYTAYSHAEGGFKMGLQFGPLDDKSKQIIQQYVR